VLCAAAGEAGGEGAGAGGSGGDDGTEFGSLLLHMGVVSPVTRAAAGALYHVELSRQLAEFLRCVRPWRARAMCDCKSMASTRRGWRVELFTLRSSALVCGLCV
jgi:hypothetical protein